ncbi:MAG: hypothetical protein HQL36_03725 [Alphaproteobacteria bacterium]|nr:hypothetical protein [Alphaproteobacteria bacterium]MBF0249024.1 hypothetical protein [Alphaproteobacteria bacterium]
MHDSERGVEKGRCSAQSPMAIFDLYGFFHGTWRFERKIHDSASKDIRETEGGVTFTPDGDVPGARLLYRESAEHDGPEAHSVLPRDLVFNFPTMTKGEVRFADGTLFHVLDLGKGIVRVQYENGNEIYHGLYRALEFGYWLSVWRIEGARSNQIITTHYRRLDG